MMNSLHIDVLRKICSCLTTCQSNWVITGSFGMALQGIDVEIHDIDIQTSQPGAYEIGSLLAEYVITPVHFAVSERICSHFGTFEIDTIQVEVMGDIQKLLSNQIWEEPVRVEQHRQWIRFAEIEVPVLSLEYEYQAYRKLGRIAKAEKIMNWLEKSRFQNENAG